MARKELCWTNETYTSKKLYTHFTDRLPIIVMASEGFCGSTNLDTVDPDTVSIYSANI